MTFLTEFEFQERVDNLFDEIDGVFDVKFFARYVIGDLIEVKLIKHVVNYILSDIVECGAVFVKSES